MSSPDRPALRPLRVWIPLVLLAAMAYASQVPAETEDGPAFQWAMSSLGPALGAVLLLLWWLLASRASWRERVLGALGTLAALVLSVLLSDPSARGPVTVVFAVPLGFGAFALAAVLQSRVLSPRRTWIALAVSLLGFGSTTLVRNQGLTGDFHFQLFWRWSTSSEDLLLAQTATPAGAEAGSELEVAAPAWPGFRGPGRDGVAHGSPPGGLARDWEATPPELLWKERIGPGWSSFAVAGGLLFTQEQRGPSEAVVCLDAKTGARVWVREIEARFEDPLGGPGPRATPTLAGGALFVQGAAGDLARLDPATGAVQWSVDLKEAAGCEAPGWGFASSPLVMGERVIVFAGGPEDRGTLAFAVDSGELVWSAPAGEQTYGSPQRATLLGQERVLLLTNLGLDVLDPATGAVLLAYPWKYEGYRALQPHVLDGTDVLLPTGPGAGTRRIRLSEEDGTLAAEEVWTSRFLKPDYNDLVTFEGSAFGFDASMFTCIDLATGDRRWKEGRYGKGQVLLLADEGLLLVSAESGEVVLLEASSEEHRELGRFQALEGKTWNHPVVVGDRLYLRNSQEAACYRLP